MMEGGLYMRKSAFVLLAFVVACSSGKNIKETAAPMRVIKDPVKISAKEIVVTEMGLADKSLPENQQRYQSKQAATVLAERAIRRAIEAYIESEVVVEKGMIASDVVRERVSGTLRGAEILTAEYESPSTCNVTMRISKEKMQELVDFLAESGMR